MRRKIKMRFIKISLTMVAALALSLGIINFATGTYADAGKNISAAPDSLSSETTPATTAADTYAIDPAHSSIGFSVRHLIINNIPGRFKEYNGTISYEAADITKSSVQFTAKVASIDTEV